MASPSAAATQPAPEVQPQNFDKGHSSYERHLRMGAISRCRGPATVSRPAVTGAGPAWDAKTSRYARPDQDQGQGPPPTTYPLLDPGCATAGHLETNFSDNMFMGALMPSLARRPRDRMWLQASAHSPLRRLQGTISPWPEVGRYRDHNYGEAAAASTPLSSRPAWRVAVIVRSFARIHESN